ncbi:MAG TPA: PfkB family carbohydrate kinase, partial [Fimbriimonas sp.]|nr:PfkB family carbohydrate kinase [Fimbriimonas sp.]
FYCEPGSAATFLPAFPAESILDSTGAGDAFRAGVIYGLIHGSSIGHSMMFGAASAALKVAHLGATEHIPTVQEVGALIAANPEVAKLYNF